MLQTCDFKGQPSRSHRLVPDPAGHSLSALRAGAALVEAAGRHGGLQGALPLQHSVFLLQFGLGWNAAADFESLAGLLFLGHCADVPGAELGQAGLRFGLIHLCFGGKTERSIDEWIIGGKPTANLTFGTQKMLFSRPGTAAYGSPRCWINT